MDSKFCLNALVILAFALAISVQATQAGEVICEKLDQDTCAFAVSYEGKRCVLEKHVRVRTGSEAFTCRASEIEADKLSNVIESDRCVNACGLDRNTLGISSDSLLESRFTRQLCSDECYHGCPNVVDLYFNLAAGEGVFLPKLCEAHAGNVRREMAEIRSSGFVPIAPGPLQPVKLGAAPLSSPVAEPPVTVAEPPILVAEPPVDVADSPVPVAEPPVYVADSPVPVAESPLSF